MHPTAPSELSHCEQLTRAPPSHGGAIFYLLFISLCGEIDSRCTGTKLRIEGPHHQPRRHYET